MKLKVIDSLDMLQYSAKMSTMIASFPLCFDGAGKKHFDSGQFAMDTTRVVILHGAHHSHCKAR